jgi:hypothetical protein
MKNKMNIIDVANMNTGIKRDSINLYEPNLFNCYLL